MGERADRVSHLPSEPAVVMDDDLQRTRQDMSETLDAIQAKLAPDRIAGEAKDAAKETVDHAVEEVKASVQDLSDRASLVATEVVDQASVAAKDAVSHAVEEVKASALEWSELASVAAMEAVDHALLKMKDAFPDLTHQAQDAARAAVDHAIAEAKTAVREIGDQTRAAVRDATVGRIERMAESTSQTTKYVGSTTITTIKQNPGPAAVAAFGIGWLILNGRRGVTRSAQPSFNAPSQPGADGASKVGQAQDAAGEVVGQVHDGLSSAAGQVQSAASSLGDHVQSTVTDIAGQVQETVAGTASQVQETVVGAASQVSETAKHLAGKAQQAPSRLRTVIQNSPLPLGLVALAVGSAAALSVPESHREHALLGEARDNLMQTAQTTVQSTIEKVKHTASEVEATFEKESKSGDAPA